MRKLINKTVHFLIFAILGFSLLSFVVCYVVYSVRFPDTFRWYEGLWGIVSCGIVILTWKLSLYFQNQSEKKLILSMCLIEIVLSAILNLSYNTQPCSDYSYIWQAAKEMANNTFTNGLNPKAYMYYYNWQLGISAFESLLIRVFGPWFSVTKIFNTLLVCTIDYCVYLLCKRKTTKQVACTAYVTATLFLPWVLTMPQLTNHHLALVIWFLCLLLTERNSLPSWIAAGICAGLLNVIRPYGILLILSVICLTVYSLIVKKQGKSLLYLLCFMVAYIAVIALFDWLFIRLGYTDAPISQARLPYFKFQRGMTDYKLPPDLWNYHYDYERYNDAMRQELLSAITEHPGSVLYFIADKMVRYLGLYDRQFIMTYGMNEAIYQAYPVRALYCVSWFQYIAVLIFAIFGYRQYIREHEVDVYQIFFIGNTLVYIFIEAVSSYRTESYPLLLVLSALGMTRFGRSATPERIQKNHLTVP